MQMATVRSLPWIPQTILFACSVTFSRPRGHPPLHTGVLLVLYGCGNASDVRRECLFRPNENCSAVRCRLPVSRRADPKHPFSRVGAHYDALICRVIVGVTYITIGFSSTSLSKVLHTMCTSCASSKFFAKPAECVPLGMLILISCMVPIAAYSAAHALRCRAIEFYGTEMVTAPQSTPVFPYFGTRNGKLIPAWRVPHVADLAGDASSEKSLI
ncbi:hypothetical protein B0H12DRAFT_427900 [Mycena haematopus]|nr:hypothetical protein B0H12DRAFT_427900 [Mycena haematopus]